MEFRVLIISIGFLLSFVFSACSKKVNVEIPGYEEKVVIEGAIETDGAPFVLISKNKNLYASVSQTEILGSYLSGAQVWVSDGTNSVQLTEICTQNLPAGFDTTIANFLGVSLEMIHEVNICAYICLDPNFVGEVGKTYDLKVVFENKIYEASSSILPAIPLVNSYWKEDVKQPGYGYSHHKVIDPANQKNGYKFEVKRLNIDSTGQSIDKRYYTTFTPYFDDEFFNGKSFEFYYENPMAYGPEIGDDFKGYYKRGDTVEVKFSNYEHKVYNFLYAITLQKMTGGSPFSMPTNAVGNISGALGSWIAFSPSYSTFVCQ